jgi:hypothetical protein
MSIDPDRTQPCLGDRLARASEAIIDERKLRDYALNPDHPQGGPKARVFASVFGIGSHDWEHLRAELIRTLPGGRVDRIRAGLYATTYGVTLAIRGRNDREARVITAWKLRDGVPHLVSVYVDVASLDA